MLNHIRYAALVFVIQEWGLYILIVVYKWVSLVCRIQTSYFPSVKALFFFFKERVSVRLKTLKKMSHMENSTWFSMAKLAPKTKSLNIWVGSQIFSKLVLLILSVLVSYSHVFHISYNHETVYSSSLKNKSRLYWY